MPHDSLQQISPAWGCGWDGENTVLKTFEKRLFRVTGTYLTKDWSTLLAKLGRTTSPFRSTNTTTGVTAVFPVLNNIQQMKRKFLRLFFPKIPLIVASSKGGTYIADSIPAGFHNDALTSPAYIRSTGLRVARDLGTVAVLGTIGHYSFVAIVQAGRTYSVATGDCSITHKLRLKARKFACTLQVIVAICMCGEFSVVRVLWIGNGGYGTVRRRPL